MRILGIILIIVSLPAFIAWLRVNPHRRKYAILAIGFLPFGINYFNLDAALVSWSMWPGHTKGMLVTVLDTLALAVIFTSRGHGLSPPLLTLLVLYMLTAVISIFVSAVPMSSAFYAFQILRVLIVFWAVSLVVRQSGSVRWLAYGLAGGAIFQCFFTVLERAGGAVQAAGTMGHQNLLGMMLHFAIIPLVAMILAGERSKLIIAGAFAGMLAAALTASRGTIGFLAMGVVLLIALSIIRKPTRTKWQAVGMGILAAAVVIPLSFSSLNQRFEGQEASGYDERAAFENAANLMWAENPMGVGANQYVVTANSEGYSDRAGVAPILGSRSAHVHNIYLLHAAEMGWLGLIAFSVLVVGAVYRGVAYALRKRNRPDGDIVLGASIAILTMAVHGFFEWIIVYYQSQYLLAIALGIISGKIARQNEAADSAGLIKPKDRQISRIVKEVMR